MTTEFNGTWEEIAKLNAIPKAVYNQGNILKGAPQEFIDAVLLLESMPDKAARAIEARKFLAQYRPQPSISYTELRPALLDYTSESLDFWRGMYFLERSIPPRKIKTADARTVWAKDTPWIDRLKIFTDTATVEHAVNGKQLIGLPGPIRFSKYSGDHDNLEAKPGEFAPDFYCWDTANNRKYASVELKCPPSSDINWVKSYYAPSTKRYNARFVLAFLSDHSYKLIDYDTDTVIDQPDLPVPENLLIFGH